MAKTYQEVNNYRTPSTTPYPRQFTKREGILLAVREVCTRTYGVIHLMKQYFYTLKPIDKLSASVSNGVQ